MPATAPPTITLAVMVRDDARRLNRCLESMKGHVQEIVVLDTGSKDDTIDVAMSHQARVQRIEWPNDFSAALNVLLSQVHTTWTFRLDSDEWMDPSQASLLRTMARDEGAFGFRLIRRDMNQEGTFAEIHLTRLWRTHEKIRYSGAVYESISMSDFEETWPGKHIVTSDVYLWHDGYATDLTEKTKRNIVLLRKELETTPGRIEAEAMLATTLQSSNDPEGLERLCSLMDKLTQPDVDRPGSQVALAIAMYMSAMPEAEVKSEKTSRLIQRAVAWYPKNPAILYYAAILEKERGNLETALSYLLKLEARAELGDSERSMSIPQEFLGEKLWNALGFIGTQLGRRDVVQRCNRHMIMLRSRRS